MSKRIADQRFIRKAREAVCCEVQCRKEMVQILMRLDPCAEDWTIIELQGALETREGVSLEGKHVGDLHFDNIGVPQLIIGHHLLSGKVVNLDRPYAVLKKSCEQEPMEIENEMRNKRKETEYNIVALVKRKIVFKNRPKPIIIKTEPIRINRDS